MLTGLSIINTIQLLRYHYFRKPWHPHLLLPGKSQLMQCLLGDQLRELLVA